MSERQPIEAAWSLISEVHLVTNSHPGYSFALYIIERALKRESIMLDLLPGSVANWLCDDEQQPSPSIGLGPASSETSVL